jgi:hypothetical protein
MRRGTDQASAKPRAKVAHRGRFELNNRAGRNGAVSMARRTASASGIVVSMTV